jgi:DNA invertase Pin-like site-specific DNA recombinase
MIKVTNLLTAIGLIAVSSSEQLDGISLDEQEQAIRQRCEREGWHLLEPLIILPGVSRSDPEIVSIFTSTDPKYKPYHRVREQINTQAADILIAYDDGRVGRSKSMFVYIAENAIATGMRVLLLDSGWIDADNEDFAILLGSIKATANMKRFRRMKAAGMPKRIAKGLPSSSPVMSHKIVRDDKGRAVTLVVDESRRRLLDDLAAVFLEGYAFEEVEKQLYERFGHINQRTGKRFAASMTRKLLYNPYFWGHAALGHNGKASGAWVYDLDLEPPPDVTIYRNTHPPAYTGDLALRIQAEMRRREGIRGHAQPRSKHAFSRLLYCNECGRMLGFKSAPGRYAYWNCRTPTRRKYYHALPDCSQTRMLHDSDVREYVTLLLSQIYEDNDLRVLSQNPPGAHDYLVALDAEIAATRDQLNQLIEDYSKEKRQSLREIYAEKIDQAGERLDILERQRQAHIQQRQTTDAMIDQQQHALSELRIRGVASVMADEPAKLNQFLFMLFGKFRMFVENPQIVKLKELD